MPKRQLHRNVRGGVTPREVPAQGSDQADRGVHVRPRDRPEHRDKNKQHAAGGNGVPKQGDSAVPTREIFRHDPGADDAGE
jgi:hypothetical protein